MKKFLGILAMTALVTLGGTTARADDQPGFQKLPGGNVYVRDYNAQDSGANGYTRLRGNTYIGNNNGSGRSLYINDDDNVVIYSGNGGYRRGYGYGNNGAAPAPMANPCTGTDSQREYRRCMKDAAEAQQKLYDKYN